MDDNRAYWRTALATAGVEFCSVQPGAIFSAGADADSPRFGGENRPGDKFILVGGQQPNQRRTLIARAKANETDQANVKHSLDDDQLAEIFIDGRQDSRIRRSALENLFITGIARPVASPYDIMASLPHGFGGVAGDATIEQDSHAADPAGNGSIRSWATSL